MKKNEKYAEIGDLSVFFTSRYGASVTPALIEDIYDFGRANYNKAVLECAKYVREESLPELAEELEELQK